MAFDFKLDDITNDIAFEDSEIKFTETKPELLRQRISITLRTWLEEWFLNLAFGIPYRQKIISGNVSKEEVDSEFLNAINSYDDVNYIVSFSSVADPSTRSYTLEFIVNTDEGDTEFLLFAAPPGVEIVYPPSSDTSIKIPSGLTIDDANRFYEFIHIEFPF